MRQRVLGVIIKRTVDISFILAVESIIKILLILPPIFLHLSENHSILNITSYCCEDVINDEIVLSGDLLCSARTSFNLDPLLTLSLLQLYLQSHSSILLF